MRRDQHGSPRGYPPDRRSSTNVSPVDGGCFTGEATANGRRGCDRRHPDLNLTGLIARFTPASEKSGISSGKALRRCTKTFYPAFVRRTKRTVRKNEFTFQRESLTDSKSGR
ncbi:hypothetical protein CROQUDRAFT_85772 [Cronartium quercuum f. sp. fusiforme G11]|uniref:Uncharacterized protein n=1 Tax=Cronartium quercuum f. sp. fusiforme G11 TaxID=708437 RepID=A0A9P6THG7_9BASI|nr:hypothetical protein CROQUDRAFT_85772 [Cronartium quercuum f. sp. fusiforme G11]